MHYVSNCLSYVIILFTITKLLLPLHANTLPRLHTWTSPLKLNDFANPKLLQPRIDGLSASCTIHPKFFMKYDICQYYFDGD